MRYFKYFPFLVIIFILSIVGSVNAVDVASDTIYVSVDGDDNNTGLTSQLSKKTIENAIETAKHGDTIQIAPGTYQEHPLKIDKKLTLKGENPKNTIIQGKANDFMSTIVISMGNNVLIQKLTITKADNKKKSRGIFNLGTLTVEDSIITGHKTSSTGGGVYNEGRLTLKDCQITNNKAAKYGGGIQNYEGVVILQNCIITSNEAEGTNNYIFGRGGGGGIDNHKGTVAVYDSVITSNKAKYGGGIDTTDGGLTLVNSEVTNNIALNKGGGIYSYINDDININKSVIVDNKPQNIITEKMSWTHKILYLIHDFLESP